MYKCMTTNLNAYLMWGSLGCLVWGWVGDRHLVHASTDAWWGPDKALHLSASAAIVTVGYGVAAGFSLPLGWRVASGLGLSLAAGIGKEILDLAGLGTPSWQDMAWNAVGLLVGVLFSLGLDQLLRWLIHTKGPPFWPASYLRLGFSLRHS